VCPSLLRSVPSKRGGEEETELRREKEKKDGRAGTRRVIEKNDDDRGKLGFVPYILSNLHHLPYHADAATD